MSFIATTCEAVIGAALRPFPRGTYRVVRALDWLYRKPAWRELRVPGDFEGSPLRLRLDIADPVQRAMYFGTYERHLIRFVRHQLRRDSVVVDCGAHVGFWTAQFYPVAHDGRFIVIEPMPAFADRLRETFAPFANVQVVNAAASDRDGETEIFPGRTNSGFNTINQGLTNDRLSGGGFKVATRSLDSVARELSLGRIDLVKFDVEGAESAALRGAAGLLRDHRIARLYVEMCPPAAALDGESLDSVVEPLTSAGYQGYWWRPSGITRIGNGELSANMIDTLWCAPGVGL